MNRHPVAPFLWMLCGSFAFAVMGILAHAAGKHCDWQLVAFFRSGICLVLVAALALVAGVRLVFFRPATLWLRSVAGSLSLVCTFYALPRLPVADVLTLTNMFPIWVALLSWPLLRERPPPGVWLAVGCGVLGVALIQQPHFAEGNFATLLALGSSLSTALAMIGLHRLKGIDPRAVVVHFSGVSLIFIAGAYLLVDGDGLPLREVDAATLGLLIGVGVAATVGQLFLTLAFTAGPPARVSVIGLSQVVFAMIFDVAFLGRTLEPLALAGMALVLLPVGWLMVRHAPPDEVVEAADA